MKTKRKHKIINTYNFAPGEPLQNFGGKKPRYDSEKNELPEMSESAAKVLDAYSNIESISLIYDSESDTVKITGKCLSGTVKL